MAWTDARDFLEASGCIRRESLIEAAMAARAAQADEKSWRRWMNEVMRHG